MADGMTAVRQKCLLIVEDNERAGASMGQFLRRRDYDVQITRTTAEALHILDTMTVDLAIIDVYLADDSGFSFLREMRDLGHKQPVLMISGDSSEPTRQRALRAG